ncbi:protein of unknown function DUF402 [Staphylothermus marinus F1]|uniref:Probable ribonuclease FAU-1 n=1 Tax=Staphylothermus marinus (strain ATCC 43588 / DSM 3639 / JCM 9404 / F1) TaxID=399550 RepID=FAU1_STAMF|nr:DUF402 domain-containing protein [Staphylothermus marinus]A3DM74.1 RecName: Full=Probable ribonuclease FAU-1; AltName: Full=RNA-binding protein FAU-1 [Staphylothermus marinus F1]ABN69734.1 protein of unknown function DUF402 [Staphylothermus marinus F1]
MCTGVRVRGITATAVSKILLDKGYRIVQASNIIRERFNLPLDTSPADVTVKDADKDELLVLGFYGHADKVYNDLVDELEYSFKWVSPVGLHSIHLGLIRDRVGDKCIVEIGNNVKGVLPRCNMDIGKKVLVGVAKAPIKPGEEALLTRSIRVVGKYVSIIYGKPSLTISEHIRDHDKREYLLAIAMSKIMGSGLGVHLRSSSQYAGKDEIEREIDELKQKLRELLDKAKHIEDAPTILYEGEFIGLIGLTSLAKEKLDSYRDKVVPTITRHHSLKSCDNVMSDIVDYSEILLRHGISRKIIYDALSDYILEKNRSLPKIRIIHIKPDGTTHTLSPGTIYEIVKSEKGVKIVLKRTLRNIGVYDGLGVEKKPGDIDYMVIEENSWIISHNYYRGNEWLGSYININTPPEILPGIIKYHDLLIDVIVKNTGEARIIDEEELKTYYEKEIIPEKLYEKALEVAKSILENHRLLIYRPNQQ